MTDQKPEQKLSDSLRDWGFDLEAFEKRAKQSIEAARGDLSEVSGTLKSALGEARQVIVNLKTTGGPAASELKTGFEQAWDAIERAFGRAKERMREKPAADAPAAEATAEPPADEPPADEPPPGAE